MNVVAKMNNVTENFIEDYIRSCGIKKVGLYLHPDESCYDDPLKYSNIKKAVKTFESFKESHEQGSDKIGIIVDSDLDGVCSASIVYMFCKNNGFNPKVYFHDGKQHGVHDKLEEILKSDIDLLFVPDAGSNDVDDCAELKRNKITTIVLDHHEIINKNSNAIVVNHHLKKGLNTDLSGAGVAYKFVQAYYTILDDIENCPNYKDLVAVSIVSDICNLTAYENRAFLNDGLTNPTNEFIKWMFENCCSYRGVNPNGIGWDIAPLANALARSVDVESKPLFFNAVVGNADFETTLKLMKKVKKTIDDEVKVAVSEIESNIDLTHKVIIGFGEEKDKAYLGLIANKFCGKYNKPTILLREINSTTWSGSMRSPIDLADKINESGLALAQGHQAACGITVKKANLNKFASWLDSMDLSETPNVEVTASVSPDSLNNSLMNSIVENKILWGTGILSPTFYMRLNLTKDNVFVYKKRMTTLKIQVGDLSIIKFFATNKMVEEFTQYDNFELEVVVGDCKTNEYEGVITPQCELISYEIHPIEKNEESFNWDSLFE